MKKPSKKQNDKEQFDPSQFSKERDLTNKAIFSYLSKQLSEKDEKRKDIEALVNTVQEFLNSFIILGYTFNGEPVNFVSAHNQQEADSLATLANKFFIQNNTRDNS